MRILALAIAALLASPAAAQDETPRKLDPLAIQVIHNFGKCVAKRNPGLVDKVLALDFHTPGYKVELRRLTTGQSGCINGGKLASTTSLFAGALAEGRLTGESGQLAEKLTWHEGEPVVAARNELEAMGLCIVRKSPEAVITLLRTEVNSEQEKLAFKGVTLFLGECTANGTQLRINRPGLRAQVALAAWRVTHMPVSGS
jgi:hypothetical protein